MRTIFVSSFHVFVSHFILGSPFWDELRSRADIRVVLLVPAGKRAFFERYFGGGSVIVEGVRRRLRRVDSLLNDLGLLALRTAAARNRRRVRIGLEFWHSRYLFSWAPLLPAAWYRAAYAFFTPRDTFASLLDRYRPALVFATDVFSPMDCRLMLEARDRGIPLLGMVRSWDNLTTKGLFRLIPETVLVASDIMAREAVELHGIAPVRIRVVGIPVYDHYARYRPSPPVTRDAFFRRIGADPARRLVLYAPSGDRFFPSGNRFDRGMIELLSSFLPPDAELLVRLPPADSVDLEGMAPRANVRYDRPGTQLDPNPAFFKANELSPDDREQLLATIAFCDLMVFGTMTTLGVEAAIFDKPLILCCADLPHPLPPAESVARHCEYDHVQPIIRTGGVRVVRSRAELARAMADYLQDPVRDREGRKRIVREQCPHLGVASQRLLAVLREVIRKEK